MNSVNFKAKKAVKLGACFLALVAMLCAEVTTTRVNDCGRQVETNQCCYQSSNNDCGLGDSAKMTCCSNPKTSACCCSAKVSSQQKPTCTCVDCKCGEGETPPPQPLAPTSQSQSELVFVTFLDSFDQIELPWSDADSNSHTNSAARGLSLTSQEMCVLLSRFTC